MRQGKLSELIHNSANYPDLDECSVEVHFREIIDLVLSYILAYIPLLTTRLARARCLRSCTQFAVGRRTLCIQE